MSFVIVLDHCWLMAWLMTPSPLEVGTTKAWKWLVCLLVGWLSQKLYTGEATKPKLFVMGPPDLWLSTGIAPLTRPGCTLNISVSNVKESTCVYCWRWIVDSISVALNCTAPPSSINSPILRPWGEVQEQNFHIYQGWNFFPKFYFILLPSPLRIIWRDR